MTGRSTLQLGSGCPTVGDAHSCWREPARTSHAKAGLRTRQAQRALGVRTPLVRGAVKLHICCCPGGSNSHISGRDFIWSATHQVRRAPGSWHRSWTCPHLGDEGDAAGAAYQLRLTESRLWRQRQSLPRARAMRVRLLSSPRALIGTRSHEEQKQVHTLSDQRKL